MESAIHCLWESGESRIGVDSEKRLELVIESLNRTAEVIALGSIDILKWNVYSSSNPLGDL